MDTVVVEKLCVGAKYQTEVWASLSVQEALDEVRKTGNKKQRQLVNKIDYYAEAGFRHHEGSKGSPIRSEGDGVYRIGAHADLFRVLGFYTSDRKDEFIAIAAFTKKLGQNLSNADKNLISLVAEIKRDGTWKKAKHNN